MFSSLKHPARRKILRLLTTRPQTFTEILEQINIESAHLSYHLESLGDLIKKTNDGKYSLSDFGKAAVSLMVRVEEPEKLVSPAILQTPKRLKIARIFSLAIIVTGALFLVNGMIAFPTFDYKLTRMQTNVDTDYWVFQPNNVTGFAGFFAFGDGLYGVEIDCQIHDAYDAFPLTVRLCTPEPHMDFSGYWNDSWYEWTRTSLGHVPDQHERLSVTLLASGSSAQVISQEDFGHVHPSPGKVIGKFRRTSAYVLVMIASDEGDANVTLSGFRAFQIRYFYLPQVQDNAKNTFVLSGLVLIAPSATFMLSSRKLPRRKENY